MLTNYEQDLLELRYRLILGPRCLEPHGPMFTRLLARIDAMLEGCAK